MNVFGHYLVYRRIGQQRRCTILTAEIQLRQSQQQNRASHRYMYDVSGQCRLAVIGRLCQAVAKIPGGDQQCQGQPMNDHHALAILSHKFLLKFFRNLWDSLIPNKPPLLITLSKQFTRNALDVQTFFFSTRTHPLLLRFTLEPLSRYAQRVARNLPTRMFHEYTHHSCRSGRSYGGLVSAWLNL